MASSSSSSHKNRSPVLTLFFVTLFLLSAFIFIFIFRDRDTNLISESDLLLLQTPPLSFPAHTPNETQTNQLIQQLEHKEREIEPKPESEPEPEPAIATDTKISVNDSDETQAESEGEEQKTVVGKSDENDRKSESDSDDEVAAVKQQQLDCDLYSGIWVKDEANYPIYEASSCPYVDEAYDCQANGRKDSDYTRWRWKPHGCDLPRFNATDFLRRLQGKKVMLVGDSMNRNQFESFLCMLREGLHDKTKMYEVHGYKITKGRGYFVFKFEDYNCTVEFVRSHFLVREGVRVNGQGSSNPILSIDRIDKTFRRWKRADILVFNTGHWWTHGKTARGVNYYKEGDQIYPKFDAVEAYRRAIKTWANWIDHNINPKKQIVYYRGYSSAHFR
ncbi:Protein trichome birefringence-like 5, variant 2 [Stylosanthes scabra]|nr:Protein trichome birefringence-like 5, variant 2 [Stylosanthes scabra]